MNTDTASLAELAQQLRDLLEQTQTTIVFAESCTGGLVAASLASIAGISRWLCGSAVTYQEQTKIDWLGVSAEQLRRCSAVSQEVALAMAQGALERTTTAQLAVAVTGHLGPGAPVELDGTIFIAAAQRDQQRAQPLSKRVVLAAMQRHGRQQEAAACVLKVSIDAARRIKNSPPGAKA